MAGLTGFFAGIDRALDPSGMKDLGKETPEMRQRRAAYYGQDSTAQKSASLDESKYPKAVPGGYTITPQHARGADGKADRTWLHPDLPGPSTNRVNKDYDTKQPGVQGSGDPKLYRPAPIIDTTQAASTPIVTRSRDETYNAFLQQYGFDGEKAKAAADTRGDLGSAYRAGDPLAPLPDALRPGSEAYMQSEDMRIWAQANPTLAKKLRPPTQAKIGGKSYSISEEAITDTMDQNPGVDREQAISLIRNGGRQPQADINGTGYDIEESAITDTIDQNPGISRDQAINIIRDGRVPSTSPSTRLGPTSYQVPEKAVDRMVEQKTGMKPNSAIDMTRSEEPFASEMSMGKSYTNPFQNRSVAFTPHSSAAALQSSFTGTQDGGTSMQPPSGLNDAMPLRSPLKYQQGNIHERLDEYVQQNNDYTTADDFVFMVQDKIGKELFGQAYSPVRVKPV